jgi:putative ABC transport system permease protein
VSPSYFSTLDLPIVAGAPSTAATRATAVPVAIVNEAFAKALGGRSPDRLCRSRCGPPRRRRRPPVVREIVGVAKQVKGRPDEARDFVQVYAPLTQDLSDDVYLVVRPKTGEASALTPAVRAAVGRVDRERLVGLREVLTLADIDRAATGRHRFRAVMVAAFALLALVLAMVGVFGILAYSAPAAARATSACAARSVPPRTTS